MMTTKQIKAHKKFVEQKIKDYDDNTNVELRHGMLLLYEGQLLALKAVLEIDDRTLTNQTFK